MATAFPNITMTLYENETLYGNESTNSSILSLEEFIHQFRGPNSLPKVDALTMTVVYMAILITGVLGNALVCLVIIRNSKMHNATNFYLFSLAVSDLTFLIVGTFQLFKPFDNKHASFIFICLRIFSILIC